VRDSRDVCGCFPVGRHYPGIADRMAEIVTEFKGLADEFDPSTVWSQAPLAAIDFETTGLSPETDRVIEIGIACYDQGQQTRLENWLVNPGVPVPEEARSVHKISDQELAGAPPFDRVFEEVCQVLGGRLPLSYNADFDRGFLLAEHRRLGSPVLSQQDPPPALRAEVTWIDPLVWVRELQRDQKGKKLADACARLGVPLEVAHRAAGDAQAAAGVLLALAPQMPATYGELIRVQRRYAARQHIDMSLWRGKR
jgi:DNA polymerase-3 subunit epsilon